MTEQVKEMVEAFASVADMGPSYVLRMTRLDNKDVKYAIRIGGDKSAEDLSWWVPEGDYLAILDEGEEKDELEKVFQQCRKEVCND
jgi:hypothetical protein